MIRPLGDGNDEVNVFARDGDLFHGHLIRAYISTNPNPEGLWRCQIFNNRSGSGTDTAPHGIGSSPVAVFNGPQNRIDIIGTEFGGSNRPTLWGSAVDRWNGRMSLQPSSLLSQQSLQYPTTQFLGIAVQHEDGRGRLMNVFYRTTRGTLGLSRFGSSAYSMDVLNPSHSASAYLLTNNSPAAATDPAGNLHVFSVEQARDSSHLFLIHYRKTSANYDGSSYFMVDPTLLNDDLATTDGGLSAVYSPEPFVP